MRVDVLIPSEAVKCEDDAIYVVIDTFRATTSLTTLKYSKARRIFVVEDGFQAFQLKKHFCSNCLLIGEENGIKIKGFDYGNTASLFYDLNFKNNDIIFTSSSGAKVLLLLEKKENVFLCSLINISAVSLEVIKQAKNINKNIVIVPSGYFRDESILVIEDWITAVILANKISKDSIFQVGQKGDFWKKTELILSSNNDIQTLLRESTNGKSLMELGFESDVNYAIQIDITDIFLKVKKWLNFNEIKSAMIE